MGAALPIIAIGSTIAGGLVKADGAMAAGEAGAQAAAYRAQVARNNAEIAEQQAHLAEGTGAAREGAQAMKTAQSVGGLKTQQAASGVKIDGGSSADVRAAAVALGELDALTIRQNTAREVYGYKVQAGSDRATADLESMKEGESRRAGRTGALASLLETASSVGGKFAKWQTGAGTDV